MKAYIEKLRYKHMRARLKGRPVHKLEAQLHQEIATGSDWRVAAVIEAISQTPGGWNSVDKLDVFRNIGRYGRQEAFNDLVARFKLADKADVQSPPREIVQAFDAAVVQGHYRLANGCLLFGVRPDMMLADGQYPRAMAAAMEARDLKKIDYLLDHGADLDYHFTSALQRNDLALVRHFVGRGADVNRASSVTGYLPLVTAAQQGAAGDTEVFKFLVAQGATVGDQGETALLQAVNRGCLRTMRLLLAHGAEPSDRLLFEAISLGRLKIAHEFVERGIAVDAPKLYAAILSRDSEENFDFCVRHGADIAQALRGLENNPHLYAHSGRERVMARLQAHLAEQAPAAKVPSKPPRL